MTLSEMIKSAQIVSGQYGQSPNVMLSMDVWEQIVTTLKYIQDNDHVQTHHNDWTKLERFEMVSNLNHVLPNLDTVEINIRIKKALNFTAYSARQMVDEYVFRRISDMMYADEPTFILGKKCYWHVPVILSLTSKGRIGQVGSIDVDIETGQMQITLKLLEEIKTNAKNLAQRTTSSTET